MTAPLPLCPLCGSSDVVAYGPRSRLGYTPPPDPVYDAQTHGCNACRRSFTAAPVAHPDSEDSA